MANKAINELPAAESISPSALMVIYQDAATQRITGAQLIQLANVEVYGAAQEAKSAAEAAAESAADAQEAAQAVQDLGVSAQTIPAGQPAVVEKQISETGVVTLVFSIPQGAQGVQGEQGVSVTAAEVLEDGTLQLTLSSGSTLNAGSVIGPQGEQGVQGPQGPQGVSIQSIQRTAGTGAPGTTDTYTITLTNGSTFEFQVYNGADGGVVSFNGRSGAVEPQKGDYTAEQVGAIPQVNGAAGQFLGFTAANVVGAVDAPEGGGESKLIYAYSGAWSGNSYTISDSFFKKTGFVYLVCPMSIGTLADDYNDAGITINNVTTDDTLVINAANVPQTKNLVMVATRIPSTSSNGAVYYTNGFYIDVDALKQSITPTYNVVIDSSLNIPAGLMLGDVNQDGRITAADADIVQNSLVGGSLTPEQQELADMDGSGSINISDAMTIRNIANGATKVGAASKDITGVWSVNPDYAIEPAQFYVDIPLSGLTPNSNIALVTQGENASLVVKVEAMSGAFRVYATLLPISPIPYKLIQ